MSKAKVEFVAESGGRAEALQGAIGAGIALVVAGMPFLTSAVPGGLGLIANRWVTVGVLAGVHSLLALGLLVAAGWAGQFVLGYAAFFAIGAYTYGLLNSFAFGLHLGALLSIPLAVAASIAAALMLGATTRRIRGDYFALVTLAFGEMVRIALVNGRGLTGGNVGLLGIDPIYALWEKEGPAVTSALARYGLVWVLVGVVALWLWRSRRTPLGRAWVAIREDEEAARAIGIRTFQVSLIALSVSAAVAGLAGCLFAAFQLSLSPSSFGSLTSFMVLTAIVLGGTGSLAGAVLGTLFLLVVPELVRDASGGQVGLFDYQMLIYGLAMIVVILLKPDGLTREPLQGLRSDAAPDEHMPAVEGASLEVTDLTVRFGGILALNGVSFTVPAGQVVGIIGPNGSGKTTLLNTLSGFQREATGDIRLDRCSVVRLPPERRARLGLARTFQMNRLFNGISNAENLAAACNSASAPPSIWDLASGRHGDGVSQARAAKLLEGFTGRFPPWRWVQSPTTLSYANRRRLELARAIGTRPRLLLLDEPSAGMNPVDRRELLGQIRKWADDGTTTIIVEHQLGALAAVADRLIALDRGAIISDGHPTSVLADDHVVHRMMGVKAPK